MNRERGNVDRALAFHHFTFRIHQDQVRSANLPEMQTEGVDPKMILPFRVTRCNVSGGAFVETKLSKRTEGGGETLLEVLPFFPDGCKFRNRWDLKNVCGCGAHTTPRPDNRREL